MFDQVAAAHITLQEVASEFDASALTPEVALRFMQEFGLIRRLVDGMVGPCAKRLAETSASAADAVASVAKTLGTNVGEVRGAISTAKKREGLPATDRAVREGALSAQEAQLIAGAAAKNPAAEQSLIALAEQGLVPLKDACIRARAAVEDPAERAKRHHRQREWRSWTDADGMVVGRFRFAPEVGGPLTAKIEAQAQRIFKEPQSRYRARTALRLCGGRGRRVPARRHVGNIGDRDDEGPRAELHREHHARPWRDDARRDRRR